MMPTVIFVVGLLLVAFTGFTLALQRLVFVGNRQKEWLRGPADRIHSTRDHLVADLGPVGAFAAFLCAGISVVMTLSWAVGRLVARLESPVDRPAFDWFQVHHSPGLTSAMKLLTQVSNRPEYKVVTLAAAVVLAIAWWRRWWVPILVLVAAFVLERYGRVFLGPLVHRGHPPTTQGTYPSGGCSRLVAIYGTIVYLGLLRCRASRPVRITAWTCLALLAWVEGFSRVYLLKHWLTDAVGGWLFGTLVLLLMVGAARLLQTGRPDQPTVEVSPTMALFSGRRNAGLALERSPHSESG